MEHNLPHFCHAVSGFVNYSLDSQRWKRVRIFNPQKKMTFQTMIKRQLLLAFLFLCFYSLHAQDQEMVKRLDALMATYSSLNQYSGTVALAHDGKILYQKSFGLADQEKKRANANNSLYNIGSIGKMFTSVAILQLVKEGKLNLDAPIRQ